MNHLKIPDGGRIAYRRLEGRAPGVLFLGGFMSDMSGRKARALESHCRESGRAYVCFDYRGHGLSSGSVTDFGLDAWLDDSLAVLDALTEGTQVLVGSSMGAWLSALCLERRGTRVGALLGVGAAPDFIDATVEQLDATQRDALARRGFCELPTPYSQQPYRLTPRLIESGRRHAILSRRIEFAGPVRLLHGLADRQVPWARSVALGAALNSEDLEVRLIGGADHRLSEPGALLRIGAALDELIGLCGCQPSHV